MLRLFVIWIGKAVLAAARLRRGGSSLPGLVVERLYPNFIRTLRPHFQTIVLVTGTNGKTTTTKMLQEILRCKHDNIVHNQAGSNMSRGVISATLEAMDWRGRLHAEVGLFEIDEGFSVPISEALLPDVLLVLNLHRDQLDRYGELERVVEMLEEAAQAASHTVINYDDPRLRDLSRSSGNVSGVAAASAVRSQVPSDDALYLGDDEGAGADYDDAEVFIVEAKDRGNLQELKVKSGDDVQGIKLQIPGVFNCYNAAMALAAGRALGVSSAESAKALARVRPAFGRAEEIRLDNKKLQLLLVKNPSGFNQVVASFLCQHDIPTLIAINDNYADGRDVSWLWDVAIEKWTPKNDVTTSGSRGYDMALRLQYAGIESDTELDLDEAVARFIDRIPAGGTGYIVPTYTAMLQIRKILSSYTELGDWE